MGNSMFHWYGNQLCAIDTETTGLEAGWHEIIQICILPLDSHCKPRRDVMPFYIDLKPESPERVDPQALKVNGLKLSEIALRGYDREAAKQLLMDWLEKLDLAHNKYGERKKIIPLGQNYSFDKGFITAWLGIETYNDLFHWEIRDTKRIANYLNDHAAFHGEQPPFSKTSLNWLANKLHVEVDQAHDALSDCVTTAEVYRKLCMRGLL